MSVRFVQGDIFQTSAQAVALGLSVSGRLSVAPLWTAVQDRCPVFVSDYHKRSRAGSLSPGDLWVWREGTPWLVGMVVRDTPQSAARARYVETALLNLYKHWQREQLGSLALMAFDEGIEWAAVRGLIEDYLGRIELPVIVYERYEPGAAVESG
ncbi:MAG: hypothetical protein GX573_22085 [Chloroflexi bacterium]|nr:hypothetical protein [Chloroflexota bacterium]